MDWIGPLPGHELDRSFLEERMGNEVPGLYLWRRIQRYDPDCLTDAKSFSEWILRGVRAPLLSTTELRLATEKVTEGLTIRANYVKATELRIGEGDLTAKKQDQIQLLGDNERLAAYNLLLMSTLFFGPVVYVGETSCLVTRILQHISLGSPFRMRLATLGVDISDVAVFYCTNAELESNETRTLLEGVLTHLLSAPLTFRAG